MFLKTEKALDSFGRAPENITAAYIVWALTETGVSGADLETEIKTLKGYADVQIKSGSADKYFLGLLSCSLYNLQRTEEARTYANEIIKSQLKTGNVTRSQTSITASLGANLVIETTAISVLAWMNEQTLYADHITSAVNWLVA